MLPEHQGLQALKDVPHKGEAHSKHKHLYWHLEPDSVSWVTTQQGDGNTLVRLAHGPLAHSMMVALYVVT